MRAAAFASLVLVVCLFAAPAHAQQFGDKIVVTFDKAPLWSKDATTGQDVTIGTVPRGNILVAEGVLGDLGELVRQHENRARLDQPLQRSPAFGGIEFV